MNVTLENMRSLGCCDLLVVGMRPVAGIGPRSMPIAGRMDNTAIVDIENLFVCTECGAVGAELRPGFQPAYKANGIRLRG